MGAVASALGGIGANINLVEIVEKRGDVEVDEFILDVRADRSVESLVAACDSLAGVGSNGCGTIRVVVASS